MTIQRLSIIFAALGLGLIGLSAQPTPQPGVQPPVSVTPPSVPGFVIGPGSTPAIVVSGVTVAEFFSDPTGLQLKSTYPISWASGSVNTATDVSIVRAAAGELTYTTLAFSALGTPANGTQAFCTDCAPTTPATCPATKASCVCTNGGAGSLAIRVNSLWYCPF